VRGTLRTERGITRRLLLATPLALVGACSWAATPTRAAPPALPLLSLIVGSPPGRGADPSARAFAPFLERHLRDVRVAVLNRPGESGLSALRLLAGSDATGLALGWVSSPSLPARMVDRDAPALLDRLHLVGAVQKEPVVLVSTPRSPLASVADLLARARADGTGAAYPLGTPPPGSPGHLAALRLQALSGIRLHIVAFPSAAAARQAAQEGHAAAALLALGDAIEALREGTLSGLGIAARRPARSMPEIAPLHAAGIALQAPILRGLALPAGADPARIAALEAALLRIAADPEFIAAGDESGFHPTTLPGPTWTTQIRQDHAHLSTIWSTTPWTPTQSG
jgi:tripartite-type tricarboxylate transporter receptor subunit TctC